MAYKTETTHRVGASTVIVKELAGFAEYHVYVDGDKFEVFTGNNTDPGTDPNCWYAEVGGVIEGPYNTADALIAHLFLTEDGI